MMALHVLFFLVLSSSLETTDSHFSMWDKSMFDCQPDDPNSQVLSMPLQDMDFDEWWWHGQLDCPPRDGQFFELPANGRVDIAMSSNRAYLPPEYGGTKGWCNRNNDPLAGPRNKPSEENWEANRLWGCHNIHARNRTDVAGCALAIAYESDAHNVRPEDFVIFSVVHDCPSRQLETFDVPNLPACPDGKCMCSWFWIHKSTSGENQMYMTPFVCSVVGASPSASAVDYPLAIPPRRCWNPSHCNFGPRNPLYWRNNETTGRNNMYEDRMVAPTYSYVYGFADGAQWDIFEDTNPRRNAAVQPVPFPPELRCSEEYPSRITADQPFVKGTAPMRSPNCRYEARYSSSGNMNVYDLHSDYRIVRHWESLPGYALTVNDSNGDLTLVSESGEVLWRALYTELMNSVGPYRLELTNEGCFVLFDGTGLNMWESQFWDRREIYFDPRAPDPQEFYS